MQIANIVKLRDAGGDVVAFDATLDGTPAHIPAGNDLFAVITAGVAGGTLLAQDAPAEPLDQVKARLKSAADADAENIRLKVVTGGAAQAAVYVGKLIEATACLTDAAPTAAKYPLLAATVGIDVDPQTNLAAADVVGVGRAVSATAASWNALAGAVEKVRLAGKRDIDAAVTAAGALAVYAALAWPAV